MMHEVEEFVFIKAASEQKALEWGTCIAEKFIEEMYISHNVALRKINFTGFIWANPSYKFSKAEKEEVKEFQIVNYGEYPSWNLKENR